MDWFGPVREGRQPKAKGRGHPFLQHRLAHDPLCCQRLDWVPLAEAVRPALTSGRLLPPLVQRLCAQLA
jgi:hypothetical protein